MAPFFLVRASNVADVDAVLSVVGDYRVGETLLAESASVISFASSPTSYPEAPPEAPAEPSAHSSPKLSALSLPSLSHMVQRSRTPSPEPALTPLPEPPKPRRLVLLVVGLAPHRKLWTTSQRPGESVMYYTLLNGCPAVILPARGEPSSIYRIRLAC